MGSTAHWHNELGDFLVMSVQEEKGQREQRLRKIALQLVAQMQNESADDMRAALRYAGDLVDFVQPSEDRQPLRLHSINNRPDKSAN